MEENTDGKKKTTPSIPANYISILQLQERWINEKEKKRKEEEEERRRKQQVEEDDLKKAEEEKRLNRSNRKQWGRKNEFTNGGEASIADKEKPQVTAAEGLPEKNRGFRRKRYKSNKKKNQDVAVVEDDVDCGCVSIAPPESFMTENVTPVKDVIRVYRKKGKRVTGKKSVVTDAATAMETQFEDLCIKGGATKNLKPQTKSSNRGAASTMVWVKKERAGDGIASGVKPLIA